MAAPETKGRMINKDISESKNFAKLSPAAAVLLCMIIPHLNSYGKLKGGVGFIKDEVCPLIPFISERKLPRLLQEIDANTNVKWFEHEGRRWIHSINFLTEHQNLPIKKLGRDLLPTYSGASPGLSPDVVHSQDEVEVEVEVEGGREVQDYPPKTSDGFSPTQKQIDEVKSKYGFTDSTITLETQKFNEHPSSQGRSPTGTRQAWNLWMLRQWEFIGGPEAEERELLRQAEEEERRIEQEAEDAQAEANRMTPEETKEAIRQAKISAGWNP